jgi:hypothetical protein
LNTAGLAKRVATRQGLLTLAAVVAAAYLAYSTLSPAAPRAASPRPSRAGSAEGELPKIALSRLTSLGPDAKAGRRDLFTFGAAVEDEPSEEGDVGEEGEDGSTASAAPPAPVATPIPVPTPPPAPRLPAMNLKYVGSLEQAGGLKVAVLLTERNEILYGQVGQQVANRFKILRIGLESVEVMDEGSGQSRRIPFKGN